MRGIGRFSLPVEFKRSYMAALRALLNLNQYTLVRLINDDRIIRECEVSVIEGKIGLKPLWSVYSDKVAELIDESNHNESVKNIMRNLLKQWIEA